jgi:acetyl-CoA carboxylase biotin carboxyl carrier protein
MAEPRSENVDDTQATPPSPAPTGRDGRTADHESIGRLAERLLPALVAKVTAIGLGEVEVREGDWRIRVRRPGGTASSPRRDRARGAHAGHAHPQHPPEHARALRDHSEVAGPVDGHERNDHQVLVLSPGVGYARPSASPGTRVRAGDRIGVVDVLGIPQEIVASADGLILDVLVEAGEAVEYGEPIAAIDPGRAGEG